MHNGKQISDPKEILHIQADYYANLYGETFNNSHDDRKVMTYLNKIQIPQISGQTKEHCDMTINIEEIQKAVKDLANNKCPGPDGFPCEFYKVFWPDIGYLVLDSFNKAYEHGELSPTQKQGIINLIPKKDKELNTLKIMETSVNS